MCIALPNTERTFTVTLFLPNEGDPSFATTTTGAEAEALFARDFPDALALIPNLRRDWEGQDKDVAMAVAARSGDPSDRSVVTIEMKNNKVIVLAD